MWVKPNSRDCRDNYFLWPGFLGAQGANTGTCWHVKCLCIASRLWRFFGIGVSSLPRRKTLENQHNSSSKIFTSELHWQMSFFLFERKGRSFGFFQLLIPASKITWGVHKLSSTWPAWFQATVFPPKSRWTKNLTNPGLWGYRSGPWESDGALGIFVGWCGWWKKSG